MKNMSITVRLDLDLLTIYSEFGVTNTVCNATDHTPKVWIEIAVAIILLNLIKPQNAISNISVMVGHPEFDDGSTERAEHNLIWASRELESLIDLSLSADALHLSSKL